MLQPRQYTRSFAGQVIDLFIKQPYCDHDILPAADGDKPVQIMVAELELGDPWNLDCTCKASTYKARPYHGFSWVLSRLRNEAWLSDVYRYIRQSKLLRVDPSWRFNVEVMDLALSFEPGTRGTLAWTSVRPLTCQNPWHDTHERKKGNFKTGKRRKIPRKRRKKPVKGRFFLWHFWTFFENELWVLTCFDFFHRSNVPTSGNSVTKVPSSWGWSLFSGCSLVERNMFHN